MAEWRKKALGDITGYISKGIPPAYTDKDSTAAICVLNQKCNKNFDISYEDSRYHDVALRKVPSEKMLRAGDVLINSTGEGTAGRVAQIFQIPVPTTIDGHMIVMRPTDEVDSVYYGYAIKNCQKKIESIAEGSTGQTEINRRRLQEEVLIKYPVDKDIQKAIGHFLFGIDEKIRNNRKINDNLLAQAQTLYKQFFPYGVQDDLPDGWRIGTVGEIIEIHDSKRIPLSGADRTKMEKKIYPYYGAASLMDFVDNYIFDGKYLLLGEDGTVVDDAGYPILQYVWGQFWVNNHAHILTGRLGYDVESLYMLFKQTPVKSIVTGAVQPKISQANLRSVQVVIPPEHNLREYNDLVEPLFSLFRANEEECKTFTALRDMLLPKLMSGEIDVSAVQL